MTLIRDRVIGTSGDWKGKSEAGLTADESGLEEEEEDSKVVTMRMSSLRRRGRLRSTILETYSHLSGGEDEAGNLAPCLGQTHAKLGYLGMNREGVALEIG